MCQTGVSCVLALLQYVLKIFCFARSILIAPELFQERPMTLPRGLKTLHERSKRPPEGPRSIPGGFKTARRELHDASRRLKTRLGRLQDAPRCPQVRPKSAQDGHKSDFGSIWGGFWVPTWRQVGTKIRSKIDINLEGQKNEEFICLL